MKLLRILPLLLILQAAVIAQEAPAPKPETWNFLLLYNGAAIGWTSSTLTTAELDGREVKLEHEQFYMSVRRNFDDQAFETSSTSRTWYAPGWQELRRESVTRSGAQTEKTDVTWGKEIRIVQTIDDGKPREATLQPGETPVFGTLRAWHQLRESAAEKGATLSFQSVDETTLTLVPETWTVSGPVKRRIRERAIEGTEVRIVQAGRASTAVFGDVAAPEYFETSGGFALLRVDEIPKPFKAEPVALRSVMRANVAVPGFLRLEEMEIEFDYEHDDDDDIPAIADSNAYHDVRKLENGYALRLKSRRAPPAEIAYPLAEVAEDVKRFLEPTAMCQSDDKILAEVAKTFAQGEDAAPVVRAIVSYVEKRLSGGSGDTGAASAKQAWLEQQGDCTEHAALFVALARAAGIPARNVGGLAYITMEAGSGVFGFHAWAEVWLGEWIPVDTTVGEFGTSARYVQFDYDEPGETHGRGRSSRLLSREVTPLINHYKLETGKEWQRKEATRHFKPKD